MNLGGPELLIVVVLAALIFGAGWLPKAARNLGKAKVEFDDAAKQFADAKNSVVEASGVKQLDATMRKANKVLNTSPQKMLKDATRTAATGGAAQKAAEPAASNEAETVEPATNSSDIGDTGDDGTINVDFT